MDNGNTIGGIILIVFGTILMTLGFLFAVFFFSMARLGANDEELMGGEIQEKAQNAPEMTGKLSEIDRAVGYDSSDPSNAPVPEVYDRQLAISLIGIFFGIGVATACVGVAGVILLIVGIKLVVKGNNQRNNILAGNHQNGPY